MWKFIFIISKLNWKNIYVLKSLINSGVGRLITCLFRNVTRKYFSVCMNVSLEICGGGGFKILCMW